MRLLSHRPSVLYKVEHLATEPPEGDIAVEGLKLAGPGWDDQLEGAPAARSRSPSARASSPSGLADEQALPLPAETLLRPRAHGLVPRVPLARADEARTSSRSSSSTTGRSFGREALMRGKLGAVEVRGGELLAAAEAHDALYSFDARARAAALEIGLPLMPEGEMPVRQPRPARGARRRVRRCGRRGRSSSRLSADPSRICLEIVRPERCPDREMLEDLVAAHRKRGALIALDDLSGGTESLAYLELLKPDFAKIDNKLTAGIQYSDGRRRLVAALVECAHECKARVVAEGIERVGEFEAMRDLGVDFGQGFYFGQPTERPMAVDPRLVRARPELV